MSKAALTSPTDVGVADGGFVLVVDDEATVQLLIGRILSDAGYEHAAAGTVAAAREQLDAHEVDLMLCDVGLPDGSGVELAREVRERYPDVSVIMVSGADDPNIAAAALENGAAGYVTKPFRANDILIAVLQGLAHRAADRRHVMQVRELEQGAEIDRVTGLPDRRLTMAAVEQALEMAERHATDVGILVVDCDRFRAVNDSLGQAAGDELLSVIGSRLRALVRGADVVGRWSGDSFLVICTGVESETQVTTIAERVRGSMRNPIVVYERELVIDVSVGISIGRVAPAAAELLVREAHIALEQAKQSGGRTTRMFDPGMREHWSRRLTLETDLRGALERGELRLFYQPIVSLTSGHLAAFEALLRWEHPEHGLVLPGRFIPIAEETGLIVDIGRWVLQETCRQAAAWSTLPGRKEPIPVSANISGRQVAQEGFVDDVLEILQRTGVDPHWLGLEITEGVAIEGDSAQSSIFSLQERGVRFLLDDFGTGYSVLSSIRRYAINALKIDRAFLSGLEREGGAALIDAIVALGRSLDVAIIAEGIETHSQLGTLRRLGCEFGQGFLFARPMPAHDATRLLREQRGWYDVIVESERGRPAALVPVPVGIEGGSVADPEPQPASLDLENQDMVKLTEAADILGVSTSTVRRWADSGRLRTVRTPGGHRRLLREDVRKLNGGAGHGAKGTVRRAEPPAQPVPELAELLNLHVADLIAASGRSLYASGTPGWFGSEAASPALREWGAALASSSRSGHYEVAQNATLHLMQRADLSGTSLLERHGFLERFGEHSARLLEREHPRATVASSQRLFRVLGDGLLEMA